MANRDWLRDNQPPFYPERDHVSNDYFVFDPDFLASTLHLIGWPEGGRKGYGTQWLADIYDVGSHAFDYDRKQCLPHRGSGKKAKPCREEVERHGFEYGQYQNEQGGMEEAIYLAGKWLQGDTVKDLWNKGYFGRIRHHLAYNRMIGRLRPQGFRVNEDEEETGAGPEEPEPEVTMEEVARADLAIQAVARTARTGRVTPATPASHPPPPPPPPPPPGGRPAQAQGAPLGHAQVAQRPVPGSAGHAQVAQRPPVAGPALDQRMGYSLLVNMRYNSQADLLLQVAHKQAPRQVRSDDDAARLHSACFEWIGQSWANICFQACGECGKERPTRPYSRQDRTRLCPKCYMRKKEQNRLGVCFCKVCVHRRIEYAFSTAADMFYFMTDFLASPIVRKAFLEPYIQGVTRPSPPEGEVCVMPDHGSTPRSWLDGLVAELMNNRKLSDEMSSGVPVFPTIQVVAHGLDALLANKVRRSEWRSIRTLVFLADTRDEGFDGICSESLNSWGRCKDAIVVYVLLNNGWKDTSIWFARVLITFVFGGLLPGAAIIYCDTDAGPLCSDPTHVMNSLAAGYKTLLLAMADSGSCVNSGCYFLSPQEVRADPRRGDGIKEWSDETIRRLYSTPSPREMSAITEEDRMSGPSRKSLSMVSSAHWRASTERRPMYDGTPLEEAWVRDRDTMTAAWLLTAFLNQQLFKHCRDEPGRARPRIVPSAICAEESLKAMKDLGDGGGLQLEGFKDVDDSPLEAVGGYLYEQMHLKSVFNLRVRSLREPTILPAVAGFMESGMEHGAFDYGPPFLSTRTQGQAPAAAGGDEGEGLSAEERKVIRARLLAGRGPSALIGHAYGKRCKNVKVGNAQRFVSAMQVCGGTPLRLGGDLAAGEASVLGPCPRQIGEARNKWTRLRRFKGIRVMLRLPETAEEDKGAALNVVFAGHAARAPGEGVHRGGATLWISTEVPRLATKNTYGATLYECHGRELSPVPLGCTHMEAFRELFSRRPWLVAAAIADMTECMGHTAASASLKATEGKKSRLGCAMQWIQEIPPDMLFIRHVERLVSGLLTLGLGAVHLIGSSAGTHSAACLATWAHMESALYEQFGSPVWRPASVLLVAAGLPTPYMDALTSMRGFPVRIVQSEYDLLCPVDTEALQALILEINDGARGRVPRPDFFDGTTDVRHLCRREAERWSLHLLRAPMPAMAKAIFGGSGHSYTKLASDEIERGLARNAAEGRPAVEITVMPHVESAIQVGSALATHVRASMAAMFETATERLRMDGSTGWMLQTVKEANTSLASCASMMDAVLALSRAVSELMGTRARELLYEGEGDGAGLAETLAPTLPQAVQLLAYLDENVTEALPHEVFFLSAMHKAGVSPGDRLAKLVGSAMETVGLEGAPQLAYILGVSLVQTLSVAEDDRRSALDGAEEYSWARNRGEWKTTMWQDEKKVLICPRVLGKVYVYLCAIEGEDMTMMARFPDPQDSLREKRGQKGKGKGKALRKGAYVRKDDEKNRMTDGDCLAVSVRTQDGQSVMWRGCVQAVHEHWGSATRKAVELVSLRPFPGLSDAPHGLVQASIRQIIRAPVRAPASRLRLLDSLSRDSWAPFWLMTGVPPSLKQQESLAVSSGVDTVLLEAFRGMRQAMLEVLDMNLNFQVDEGVLVEAATEGAVTQDVKPSGARTVEELGRAPGIRAYRKIYEVAGVRGVRETFRRIHGHMAAFPPYLATLAANIERGGRLSLVNGCPGAAKTDLMAVFALWAFCFGPIKIAFVNQQNAANEAMAGALLNLCENQGVTFASEFCGIASEQFAQSRGPQQDVPFGFLKPGTGDRWGIFCRSSFGISTAGMLMRVTPTSHIHTYELFDVLVLDEMQSQSGDTQMLSLSVLRRGGLLIMCGDWHQTRTRADRRFDFDHARLTEVAFSGGAFHQDLTPAVPVFREALRFVVEPEGRSHADDARGAGAEGVGVVGAVLGAVRPSVPDPALEAQAQQDAPEHDEEPLADWGGETDAEVGDLPQLVESPSFDEGQPSPAEGPGAADDTPMAVDNGEAARSRPDPGCQQMGATPDEVHTQLFGVAVGETPDLEASVRRYLTLLKDALRSHDDRETENFTTGQAYGLGGMQGVRSVALVHMNRLRGPLAALIGYIWGYPAEDLTGDPAPCPAGPGIRPPIGKFPVPILVVDVPTWRYGEVAAKYDKARGEDGAGTTMPTNLAAVQLIRDLRRSMYRRGAAFATGERVGECGKFRAMFSYRVDADAMKRELGWEPNEQEGLQAEAATRAITVGELVSRARSEEEDLDKWLHMATYVDTAMSATGQTSTYGASLHERDTAFTRDPRQFLVMASRTREFTLMVLPYGDLVRNGPRQVKAFLKIIAELGWLVKSTCYNDLSDLPTKSMARLDLLATRQLDDEGWRARVIEEVGKLASKDVGLFPASQVPPLGERILQPEGKPGVGEVAEEIPDTGRDIHMAELVSLLRSDPGGFLFDDPSLAEGPCRTLQDDALEAAIDGLRSIAPDYAWTAMDFGDHRAVEILSRTPDCLGVDELLAEVIAEAVDKGHAWNRLGLEWLKNWESHFHRWSYSVEDAAGLWRFSGAVLNYLRCNWDYSGDKRPRATTLGTKGRPTSAKSRRELSKMRVHLPAYVAYDVAAFLNRSHGMGQQHLLEVKGTDDEDVTYKGKRLNSLMWGTVGASMDGTFRCLPLLNPACMNKNFFRKDSRSGDEHWTIRIARSRFLGEAVPFDGDALLELAVQDGWSNGEMDFFKDDVCMDGDVAIPIAFRFPAHLMGLLRYEGEPGDFDKMAAVLAEGPKSDSDVHARTVGWMQVMFLAAHQYHLGPEQVNPNDVSFSPFHDKAEHMFRNAHGKVLPWTIMDAVRLRPRDALREEQIKDKVRVLRAAKRQRPMAREPDDVRPVDEGGRGDTRGAASSGSTGKGKGHQGKGKDLRHQEGRGSGQAGKRSVHDASGADLKRRR